MPDTPLPPGSLVFCYCRDSGGPEQQDSVEQQRAAVTAYANAAGLVVVRWFTESHTARNDDRPAFLEMIDLCKRKPPPVAGVIVWHSSRFSRSEDDAPFYRALLRRNKLQLISVTDKAPDGPMGRVVESVIDFSNAEYSRALSVNVRRGHLAALGMGFIPGGKPPFGYVFAREAAGVHRSGEERQRCRLVPDPDKAPMVVQAFALRAQGETIGDIMRKFPQLHLSRTGMQTMFRNPTYRGVYRYADQEYAGIAPAIVDDATWQAAQRPIQEHARRTGGRHLLTGLLRCGYCGSLMNGTTSKNAKADGTGYLHRYYTCYRRYNSRPGICSARIVRADRLESDVVERVFASLPGELAALSARVSAAMAADVEPDNRASIEREIASTQGAISNLLDLAENGAMSIDKISERLHKAEARLRELRQQLAVIPDRPAMLDATPAEVIAFVADLRAHFDSGDIHVKRHALRRVIASITLGPESELRIKYRLPG